MQGGRINMKGVMNLAKEWLGWKKEIKVAKDTKAEFFLFLGDLLIGTLSVTDGKWKFEYSDEFKKHSEIRPLIEFPELNEVYEKEQLWQFFASRIPSMEQPDVEDVLENENIAEDDAVALLKRFGQRTITNPFELRFNEVKA